MKHTTYIAGKFSLFVGKGTSAVLLSVQNTWWPNYSVQCGVPIFIRCLYLHEHWVLHAEFKVQIWSVNTITLVGRWSKF